MTLVCATEGDYHKEKKLDPGVGITITLDM